MTARSSSDSPASAHLPWRSIVGALLLTVLGFGASTGLSAAQDPCTVATGLSPFELAGEEWCATGVIQPSEEVRLTWTTGGEERHTIQVDALPGQLGAVRVVSAEGLEIWNGPLNDGTLTSPSLLLGPGRHELVLRAGAGGIVYRATLLEPTSLPPAFGLTREGPFEGFARSEGVETAVAWTVPTGVNEVWSLSLQTLAGVSATMSLQDGAGAVLASANIQNAGSTQIPDLALPAGTYSIVLRNAPAGTPMIVSAQSDVRPDGFATEPDDAINGAHQLALARPATGRLLSQTADRDNFELPAPDPTKVYQATLSVPVAAPVSLALLGADGGLISQRDGSGLVSLRDLTLRPGDVLRVSGTLPADMTYVLLLEEQGLLQAGVEIEPNNEAAYATVISATSVLRGHFDGADPDFVALDVAGDVQRWEIEATGEGIRNLSFYDGAGRLIIATSDRDASGALRVSRLLLPPGSNVVRLQGDDGGTWLLRATLVGPPVEGEEAEPNDDLPRALTLPFDQPVIGWLDRADDRDLYAFHLNAWQRVRLSVSNSDRTAMRATLYWGDRSYRLADIVGPTSDEEAGLEWDGLLPPGDFYLELMPTQGGSADPYSLRLALPSFFDRPTDLEPNDQPWQAAAFNGGLLTGVLQDSVDWFLLPASADGAPLTIRADRLGGFLNVRFAHGDPAEPILEPQVYLYQPGETVTFTPPEGVPLLLMVGGTPGPYELSMGSALEALAALPAEVSIVVPSEPLAAFASLAQRFDGQLTIRNLSDRALPISTRTWLSDERWEIDGLPETIDLPPAREMTFVLSFSVPADVPDGRVTLEIEAAHQGYSPATTQVTFRVAAGVPLVDPHPHSALPPQLAGGINLAWNALGATADPPAADQLIDDVIDLSGARLAMGDPVTIWLAGNGTPVPVAGVVLEPARSPLPGDRLSDFAIELSTDGASFTRVLEGALSPAVRGQAFPFNRPILAVAIRLVPLSAASGDPRAAFATLAEFQAIAPPGHVLDPNGFDLADRRLGGHVVWAVGTGSQPFIGEGAVWPGRNPVLLPSNRAEGPVWVIGFRDRRLADLGALVWHERSDTRPDQRIRRIAIAASSHGPLGPWEELGEFELGATEGAQPLPLSGPVLARALRFTVLDPAQGVIAMPDRIEIRETPGPTILGLWGDLSAVGPFDVGVASSVAVPSPISTDASAPTPLALGVSTRGEVRRGTIEHWYSVELPEGTRLLHARFPDGLAPQVSLSLLAPDGTEVPFTPEANDPATMTAVASPGEWRVRVVQPIASITVAWDTSGSVGALHGAIERMVRRLALELDPQREAINLLPFRSEAESFLIPEWTAARGVVYGALHAYPFRDQSSDAESAVLFALTQLAQRPGNRALVVITDASFAARAERNVELWRAMAIARPDVFSLYLPVDSDPQRAQAQVNLLSDWAGTHGHMSRFSSQGDAELTYRRLVTWLARPASYAFTITAETTPPEPGTLIVELAARSDGVGADDGAHGPVAMAVILDASGSMLQRLGDRRRIDIAKDVLRTLGAEILPDRLPVALRVFGHDRPESCEQELFLPLAPLDRAAFAAAIDRVQSVNLARTPIAASLRAAADDLAEAAGSRIIVLITDGEETCGGDPLAEIAALRAEGFEVRLNIVGFAIDDPATRALFETWAEAGAGAYFDAGDQAALGAAIEQATALPFVVLDAAGVEVAAGVVAGDPVPLPPGNYRLRVGDGPEQAVVIREGEEQRVVAGAL